MTASAPSASFEEKFAALRRDWRAQLPAKLTAISAAMDACLASPQDAAALENLHRQLHTLAGSAGTFGMDGLGQQARAVEHELDALTAQPARDAAAFGRARQLLQDLIASVPQE
jgi:chemotaxis protein histidine kinase CheA